MLKLKEFRDDFDKKGDVKKSATSAFNEWLKKDPSRHIEEIKYQIVKDWVDVDDGKNHDAQKRIYMTCILVLFNEYGNNK
jgi:hypothetical protein